MSPFKSEYIRTASSVTLHVMVGGAPEDTLIVFLHGFPEYWVSFKSIGAQFAQSGYRVLLPDMRGYNLSDKPKQIAEYTSQKVAEDIVALIDHEKKEKAIVVGHDWGAQITWTLACNYSERIEKVAVLNVAHPVVFQKTLRSNFTQLRNSWYMFAFQIPWLAEMVFSAFNFSQFAKAIQNSLENESAKQDGPGSEHYVNAWNQKGAFTGMLSYYRAAVKARDYHFKSPIEVPVLIIWGDKDTVLLRQMAEESLSFCTNGRVEHIPEAGHFVQHDAPEKVLSLLKDHIMRQASQYGDGY